ncbi:MAG: DUF3179 domain-containing (seleno)protein [Acidimicrobiia bacterium]
MKSVGAILLFALAACSRPGVEPATTTAPTVSSPTTPQGPEIPDDPPSVEVEMAVDRVLEDLYTSSWDQDSVGELAALGDPRTAWLLADLMRFHQTGSALDELVAAFAELTDVPPQPEEVEFVWATNLLISWDVPGWEGYPDAKRRVFVPVEDQWARFFEEDVGVDWRLVTWGGVLADERPLDDNGPCNCIPALDHPVTTDAAGGTWYPDDRIVFGVVVGDESIALPKHQMEIHEMVNLTLGGRELGVPYCTLCASAQAYYTDDVPGVERVVLRTSGLLQRSNKLMYDLTTGSAIDTFTGEALTGSLARDNVVLEQVSVVASTWGEWKEAHPETRVLAEDGGIGRTYPDDPLGGRDDDGPIFPVGTVDPRLPVQEKVVGVTTSDGTPVAFPVTATREALAEGEIRYEGLTVRGEDSIRVYDSAGNEVTSHESFWFAWSQFHPGTVVWSEVGS